MHRNLVGGLGISSFCRLVDIKCLVNSKNYHNIREVHIPDEDISLLID